MDKHNPKRKSDINKKVSVIVPVYNTGRYLEKCLNSLVNQTLEDIEIIVVNDGSPDNSQDIIDRFAGEYSDKVVALKQENKGLGAARNFGVSNAGGEYIGFVDSDDWVEADMFEMMLKKAQTEEADVVICDLFYVYETDIPDRLFKGWRGKKDKPGTVADFVMHSTNPAYSWNKIYKRELLTETPFPSGYYEDIATTPIIFSNCRKITYLEKPLYYYLRRIGTITTEKYTSDNLAITQAWRRCLNECNSEYIKEAEYAVCHSVSSFIRYKPDCYPDFMKFFREYENRFKDNDYIREAILNNETDNLFLNKVIPEIIYYNASGVDQNDENTERCFKSWQKYMPGCEITGLYDGPLGRLYETGGIYLDTKILLNRPLNEHLRHGAFFAMESFDAVSGYIIGALPESGVIGKILSVLAENAQEDSFAHPDISRIITQVLISDYGYEQTGYTQQLREGITVFAPNEMLINIEDGMNFCEYMYDIEPPDSFESCLFLYNKTRKSRVLYKYYYNLFRRQAAENETAQENDTFLETVEDFLGETAVLVEQISSLQPETLRELDDMYETMLRASKENISVSNPDVYNELIDRQKKIKDFSWTQTMNTMSNR